MKNFFIFGYGVPKNIFKDDNYGRYLSFIFNAIYADAAGQKMLVVFCGGKTDCIRPPYARTEAGEMKRLFIHLVRRSFVHALTKKWQYRVVSNTVSTVENVLAAAKQSTGSPSVIFCEATRVGRVRTLARRAFGRRKAITVVPVDFDMGQNRYLDSAFLARRERHDLRHELAALKNKKKLSEWRAYHKEKLAFFRSHGYGANPDVVREWWNAHVT